MAKNNPFDDELGCKYGKQIMKQKSSKAAINIQHGIGLIHGKYTSLKISVNGNIIQIDRKKNNKKMIAPNCFMFGHNIENSFDYSEESISRENTFCRTLNQPPILVTIKS